MSTPANDDPPITIFQPNADGMVRTTSHFRKWRLTASGDYRIVCSSLVPRRTVLGGTRYARVWVLTPRDRKKA